MTTHPFRVEFVCTGNICRSPFAEYYARSAWGSEVAVTSSGTAAVVGHRATETMRDIASNEFGIDLDPHRARQARADAEVDLYLVMTDHHLERMRALVGESTRVLPLTPDGVADPYGLDRSTYLTIACQIARAVDDLGMTVRVS